MELQTFCERRLNSVLIKDKQENPNKILAVLRSELLYLLKNYMEISPDNLDVHITLNEKGCYRIEIEALVKRLKMANYIIE